MGGKRQWCISPGKHSGYSKHIPAQQLADNLVNPAKRTCGEKVVGIPFSL